MSFSFSFWLLLIFFNSLCFSDRNTLIQKRNILIQKKRAFEAQFSNIKKACYAYKIKYDAIGMEDVKRAISQMVIYVKNNEVNRVEFADSNAIPTDKRIRDMLTKPDKWETISKIYNDKISILGTVLSNGLSTKNVVAECIFGELFYPKSCQFDFPETDEDSKFDIECISFCGGSDQCLLNKSSAKRTFGILDPEALDWNDATSYVIAIIFMSCICLIGILITYCIVMKTNKNDNILYNFEKKSIKNNKNKSKKNIDDNELDGDSDADEPIPLISE